MLQSCHTERVFWRFLQFFCGKWVRGVEDAAPYGRAVKWMPARGGMGASRPTIHQMVRAIKTGTTRHLGHSIFQTSYYDHVIRGPRDYDEIFQYIQNNPAKWPHDQFYTSDGEEHL